ncbi:DNA polymerase Y family protein [Streptomyces sp. WM6378]|uniref:DNA polymerase Y family protein n=1 Tax=Streptomyces sp. WM6378 TaxID=1415557 RepID=UPI0006B02CBF|nr:hypothetical protein [Streptomyces sp. WM6378]KOU50074.1 hypothetical protein ADK54_09855 [Streptomyces sp. WM6378]
MDTDDRVGPTSSILHLRCARDIDEQVYRLVLGLIADITPVVQALPPAAAVADVAGSLRYHGQDPAHLARVLRARALGLYGVSVDVGVGPTWSVASMASQAPGPGGVCAVGASSREVTAFLQPRPVGDLPGVGPVQERTLRTFGVHSIGLLAQLPLGTVQRVVGGAAGRLLWERARGVDRRTVVPAALPLSASVSTRFTTDTLDSDVVRAALLGLVVDLGEQLRVRRQACRALTLTVVLANRSKVVRSRTRPDGPSAHTGDLRLLALEAYEALGFQRARLRALTLTAERLVSAAQAHEQLSLDERRERGLRIETVLDRVNARFGSGTVGPAAAVAHHGAVSWSA